MNAVLTWVKGNVATVIFIVLMIGALVALPIVSKKLNASIQDDMNTRLTEYRNLTKLEKTDVEVGNPLYGTDVKRQTLVNEKLLSQVVDVSKRESEDAKRVTQAAIEHNQKGRGVLLPELFPVPNQFRMDVLPERFHTVLTKAYGALLDGINAGAPPSIDAMQAVIERRKAQFVTQTLQKAPEDALDDAEQAQLREALTMERRNEYAEKALNLAIYADAAVLGVPVWEQTYSHTMVDLFNWQWDYWIVEDVLEALDDANRPTAADSAVSVIQAPAKRILELTVYDTGEVAGGPAPASSAEIQPNYDSYFTGRTTNPLYDVRLVDLRIVADTARLPVVLDALARRNFITIVEMEVSSADPFAAERQGFVYGEAHVSEVWMRLELIYLRSWTAPLMPDEMKAHLGIPLPAAPAPAGG